MNRDMHSSLTDRTHRSAYAFMFVLLAGNSIVLRPSVSISCRNEVQNFASRSCNRYLCLARNPHSSKVTARACCSILWLPKTPSELKMQWFRAFVRSWWYHDELSFCCPFRFGHLQFSNPCRPAGGDPRASSSTRGFPEECTAAFAPPALRPAFVGLAVTMVARLAPESTHRSPRYSDRLAP